MVYETYNEKTKYSIRRSTVNKGLEADVKNNIVTLFKGFSLCSPVFCLCIILTLVVVVSKFSISTYVPLHKRNNGNKEKLSGDRSDLLYPSLSSFIAHKVK